MTTEALGFLAQKLEAAGIDYAFGEWNGGAVYPYFVGDYSEIPPQSESGETETLFMLTGTSDSGRLPLENARESVMEIFPQWGFTHIFPDGGGIAVMYSDSFYIPTGTVKFRRIQINLKIKEWRGK